MPDQSGRLHRIAATTLALLLTVAAFATPLATSSAAQAASAQPTVSDGVAPRAVAGVPAAPVVLYQEDFQNAPATGVTRIADYVSTSGATYTADPVYLNSSLCNGVVFGRGATNAAFAAASFCTPGWWPAARTIPAGMGLYQGLSGLNDNLAVAEQTIGGGPSYLGVMLEGGNIATGASAGSGRFVTFSLDVGNLCSSGVQALDRFSLLDGAEVVPLNTTDYTVCTDPTRRTFVVDGQTVTVGTFTGNQAALVTSPTVGFRVTNQQASGSGNDQAFDNFRILDATPSLDKSFSAMDPITGESRVTLTITNTTDLGIKAGWSATDALPAGLVVSDDPDSATTCVNGVLDAAAGSTEISVSGDLAGTEAQRTSCTFEVDVVPASPTAQGSAAQTFQNCPSNFVDAVGLNLPTACAVVTFPAVAQLAIAKSSDATTATVEGDVVSYSVTATNTGGAAYTATSPAVVTDDLAEVLDDATYNGDAAASTPGTIAYAAPELSWSGPLAPGASVTLTYTVTATLAGDGVLANAACVPEDQASGDPCAAVSTTVPIAPAIDLTKSVSPSAPEDFAVGETVTYTFVVTNSGNLVLSGPAVAELSFDGNGVDPVLDCPAAGDLAPGEQWVCTAEYTIVQQDVDEHSITDPLVNEAQAAATASNGAAVTSAVRAAQLPALQEPGISLAKSVGGGILTAAGQTVGYEFLVTNTGNVTLTDALVDESAFSGTGTLSAITCPAGAASLAPGMQVTCTATYALTQADVDAGVVTNAATASAQPPTGGRVSSDPDDAVVTIAPVPRIGLVKSAGPGGFTHAGEVVTYTFDIVNSGNVTLDGIVVDETSFSGTGPLSAATCDSTELAPTESATCTIAYPLTQADVDAGVVTNSATATGSAPSGAAVTSTVSSALVTVSPASSISLVKSVDRPLVAGAGSQVTYAFRVTNTGQATVTSLDVAEVAFSGTGVVSAITCPETTLAPDASVVCTAGYTTTDADVFARSVTNTAQASALGAGGVVVASDESTAVLRVDPAAAALVRTGATVVWSLVAAGFGLLAVGAILVIARTRRQPADA